MGRLSPLPFLLLAGCASQEILDLPDEALVVTAGELRADPALDGRTVRVENVVILAHDTFDEAASGRTGTVYFVDAGNEPDHGLQTFAPAIRIPTGDVLAPGNLVVANGQFVRFTGPGCPPDNCFMDRVLPQLTFGSVVERVGFWMPPPPIELTVGEYLADPARYVGNLITLRDLTATEGHTPSRDGTRINPFATAEGVNVSAELYMIPGVTDGTRIARLTGVASFFFDDFVMPRSADDVELAP